MRVTWPVLEQNSKTMVFVTHTRCCHMFKNTWSPGVAAITWSAEMNYIVEEMFAKNKRGMTLKNSMSRWFISHIVYAAGPYHVIAVLHWFIMPCSLFCVFPLSVVLISWHLQITNKPDLIEFTFAKYKLPFWPQQLWHQEIHTWAL